MDPGLSQDGLENEATASSRFNFLRFSGCFMLVLTIGSYTALFLLAQRRRRRMNESEKQSSRENSGGMEIPFDPTFSSCSQSDYLETSETTIHFERASQAEHAEERPAPSLDQSLPRESFDYNDDESHRDDATPSAGSLIRTNEKIVEHVPRSGMDAVVNERPESTPREPFRGRRQQGNGIPNDSFGAESRHHVLTKAELYFY